LPVSEHLEDAPAYHPPRERSVEIVVENKHGSPTATKALGQKRPRTPTPQKPRKRRSRSTSHLPPEKLRQSVDTQNVERTRKRGVDSPKSYSSQTPRKRELNQKIRTRFLSERHKKARKTNSRSSSQKSSLSQASQRSDVSGEMGSIKSYLSVTPGGKVRQDCSSKKPSTSVNKSSGDLLSDFDPLLRLMILTDSDSDSENGDGDSKKSEKDYASDDESMKEGEIVSNNPQEEAETLVLHHESDKDDTDNHSDAGNGWGIPLTGNELLSLHIMNSNKENYTSMHEHSQPCEVDNIHVSVGEVDGFGVAENGEDEEQRCGSEAGELSDGEDIEEIDDTETHKNVVETIDSEPCEAKEKEVNGQEIYETPSGQNLDCVASTSCSSSDAAPVVNPVLRKQTSLFSYFSAHCHSSGSGIKGSSLGKNGQPALISSSKKQPLTKAPARKNERGKSSFLRSEQMGKAHNMDQKNISNHSERNGNVQKQDTKPPLGSSVSEPVMSIRVPSPPPENPPSFTSPRARLLSKLAGLAANKASGVVSMAASLVKSAAGFSGKGRQPSGSASSTGAGQKKPVRHCPFYKRMSGGCFHLAFTSFTSWCLPVHINLFLEFKTVFPGTVFFFKSLF
jgi:hypothetical protein